MEFNPFAKKFRKGQKRIALVFPNRYVGGISNIGLQFIYAYINQMDGFSCERFYYDVHGGKRSVETGSHLKDFDIALFSLQYEMDYFNTVRIIRESGFNGLKIAGGPCVMQNPKPLLGVFDAFFIGECEERLEEIILAKNPDELSGIPGIYTGREEKVKRIYSPLSKHMEKEIIGEGAYGRCFLVEIGRGCVRKCRFCIVRQIYSPPRWRKISDLPSVSDVKKVALISPSPSDHPNFKDLIKKYLDDGLEVSPSSIRADSIDEELIKLLRECKVRSLTIAPETASEFLQELLNKSIKNEDVERVAKLSEGKFEKIKLYYLIGIPGEKFDDVKAIIDQISYVKRFVRRVEVSVNPLVPKPHTPFQWLPFGGIEDVNVGIKELKRKLEFMSKECRRIGVRIDLPNLREFELQTILSRGDSSISRIFSGERTNIHNFLKELDPDSTLPWDFIDHGYKKSRLKKEYDKVLEMLGRDLGG